MFGSDSNKKDPAIGPQPAGPVTPSSSPMGGVATPPPIPPSNSVAPSAPTLAEPPAHYLEDNKPPEPSSDSGNSYIETGAGVLGTVSAPASQPVSDDLARIKQQALQKLAPLVDHLQQSPEERFKTLMMMIQASDDPQYLNEAYTTANEIKDEKEKAQALLDVVNEINYFSRQA